MKIDLQYNVGHKIANKFRRVLVYGEIYFAVNS